MKTIKRENKVPKRVAAAYGGSRNARFCGLSNPDASTASVRDAMPIATICYVCAAAVLAAMWRL